jgi:hypothetical protein
LGLRVMHGQAGRPGGRGGEFHNYGLPNFLARDDLFSTIAAFPLAQYHPDARARVGNPKMPTAALATNQTSLIPVRQVAEPDFLFAGSFSINHFQPSSSLL